MFLIYGTNNMGHISVQKFLKSFSIFFQSSLEEGGFRYGSIKTLKVASQVSLSIRLKGDLPMRYEMIVIPAILLKLETVA